MAKCSTTASVKPATMPTTRTTTAAPAHPPDTPPNPSERPPPPPSSWHAARAILHETTTQYLIDWDGADPATGARFAPTWEPKRNANASLRRAWAERRDRDRDRDSTATPAPGKRKRSLHDDDDDDDDDDAPAPRSNKKQRQASAAYYPARAIVGERRRHFRVAWEPDAATGAAYADSWEPKAFVSRDLADAWRRQKGGAKRRRGAALPRLPPPAGARAGEPATPVGDDGEEGEGEGEGEQPASPCDADPAVLPAQSRVQEHETTLASADSRPGDADAAADPLLRAARGDKAEAAPGLSPFWSPARARPRIVALYGSKIKRPLMNLW